MSALFALMILMNGLYAGDIVMPEKTARESTQCIECPAPQSEAKGDILTILRPEGFIKADSDSGRVVQTDERKTTGVMHFQAVSAGKDCITVVSQIGDDIVYTDIIIMIDDELNITVVDVLIDGPVLY